MNELQKMFNYEGREVRTVIKNDEIWFVAKDVCSILCMDSTQVRRLDDDEKGLYELHTLGGNQKMTIIDESGLYSLVIGSQKPEAKLFKKWITSEVLPSIRKTGKYEVVPQFNLPQTLPEALRAYATEIEKNQVLEIENKQQQVIIEEQKPKADFYDTVTASEQSVDMNTASKVLNMGYGRTHLFALLRKYEVLDKNNIPYQKFINRKYFEVVEQHWKFDNTVQINFKTQVFQAGIDFIRKLILRVQENNNVRN